MTHIYLFGFVISAVSAASAFVAGWCLRGFRVDHPQAAAPRPKKAERKNLAEQSLHGLHAATEAVRACVEQHSHCIQAIESELRESSATEPTIISGAADSIIAANGLVQHQMHDIHLLLHNNQAELQDQLADPYGLLMTFASLDRQKHVYRQVLRSLEELAAELVGGIQGHGQRIQQITNGLEEGGKENLTGISAAVAQILTATDEIQHKIESAEQQIGRQAEKVEMQAVLSHADLLTSLPNRRALEAELQQSCARSRGKLAYFTMVLVDIDNFQQLNSEYGHQGGDVVLRQAASLMKQLMRGKDLVSRYSGDMFAILLSQTTLHDALPVAERLRTALEGAEFSHGSYPLRLTASIGIAQQQPEESPAELERRTDDAIRVAKQSGGNVCFWHDGKTSHAVSAAFKPAEQTGNGCSDGSLTAMFRRSITGEDAQRVAEITDSGREAPPTLTGRSLFVANLQRRFAEWRRGGASVSVIVLRVDQMEQLVSRFGANAESFLRRVMGQLLEAVTRDMDERCEFENGVFAVLLPGLDEANAQALADRLRSQVRQCKVRMGDALWNITASIGLAHCSVGTTVVDVMRSAETAMGRAAEQGGDAICEGQPVAEQVAVAGG